MSFFWHLIYDLLQIFFFILIARLVLDYVQMFARSWRPSGVVLVIAVAMDQWRRRGQNRR